jgi:membrane-associated phospholipid phosphatase
LVAGVYLALGLSSISAMLLVRLFLLVLISTSVSSAYSVLTHEAIVDALWDTSLKTMFLERFPAATLEELEQAHAYAYGGCIIQDLGYYPFSSRLFSDLTHYVRSGDFIITPYFERASFQETPAVREFNRMVSGRNAALAIAAVPVSFYLAGFVRKDSYARQTALLAGEAIANAEIVAAAIKNAGRRVRPSAVPRGGNFSDTWFRARSASAGGSGSFPSAHTAAAFSVATVFAGAIPPPLLGAVGRLRTGRADWVFPRVRTGALPFRRLPGRSAGIFDRSLCRAERRILTLGQAAPSELERPFPER